MEEGLSREPSGEIVEDEGDYEEKESTPNLEKDIEFSELLTETLSMCDALVYILLFPAV